MTSLVIPLLFDQIDNFNQSKRGKINNLDVVNYGRQLITWPLFICF